MGAWQGEQAKITDAAEDGHSGNHNSTRLIRTSHVHLIARDVLTSAGAAALT